MSSSKLEEIRECCDNKKYYLIIYDGAETGDLPILICDQCIGELAFQQYIIKRYQLTDKTDIQQILENFQVD